MHPIKSDGLPGMDNFLSIARYRMAPRMSLLRMFSEPPRSARVRTTLRRSRLTDDFSPLVVCEESSLKSTGGTSIWRPMRSGNGPEAVEHHLESRMDRREAAIKAMEEVSRMGLICGCDGFCFQVHTI